MPLFEYCCMECGLDFSVSLSDEELTQNPVLLCPLCGAEHVHRKLPADSA
jgi:putative FmdB family regulatory protein